MFRHIVVTRFSVYQREWQARPTEEWLEHRWPFFEKTASSMLGREWWLLCDARTAYHWIEKLRDYGRVIIVDSSWLKTLQLLVPNGPLLTTRLDSDDILAPDYLDKVQEVALRCEVPSFICAPNGYQFDGTRYYEYSEANGPFLSYAEMGNQTVYCTAHGNALRGKRVVTFDTRSWVQVIHGQNLRNKVLGSPCKKPEWL